MRIVVSSSGLLYHQHHHHLADRHPALLLGQSSSLSSPSSSYFRRDYGQRQYLAILVSSFEPIRSATRHLCLFEVLPLSRRTARPQGPLVGAQFVRPIDPTPCRGHHITVFRATTTTTTQHQTWRPKGGIPDRPTQQFAPMIMPFAPTAFCRLMYNMSIRGSIESKVRAITAKKSKTTKKIFENKYNHL
jgi:hypothetical protein